MNKNSQICLWKTAVDHDYVNIRLYLCLHLMCFYRVYLMLFFSAYFIHFRQFICSAGGAALIIVFLTNC